MIDLRECKLYGDEKFVVPDKPVNVCESTCYSDDKVHITVDWDDIMNVPNNLATTEYVTEALAAVSTTWDGGEVNNLTTFKKSVKTEGNLWIKTQNGAYRGIIVYDENGNTPYLICRKPGDGGEDYAHINTIYSRWRPDNEYNKFLIQVQHNNNGYYTALECFYDPQFHEAKTTVRGDVMFHKNLVIGRQGQMWSRERIDGEFDQSTDKMIWRFQDSTGFEFNYDLGLQVGQKFYAARNGVVHNPLFTVDYENITHHTTEYFEQPIYVNGYDVITAETINNYIQNGGGSTGSWDGGTVNGVTTFVSDVNFNGYTTFNCQYVYMNNVSEVQIGTYDDYQAGVMWGIKMGRLYSNNMSCEYLHISQRDALDIIDQNNTTKAKFALDRTDIYTPLYVNNAEVITTANIGNYVSGGTGGGTGSGDDILSNNNIWTGNNIFSQNPLCLGFENIHAGNIGNYVSGGGSGGSWNGGNVSLPTSFDDEVTFNGTTTFNGSIVFDDDRWIYAKNRNDGSEPMIMMLGHWGMNMYESVWFHKPIFVNDAEVITTDTIGNYVSGGTGGGTGSGDVTLNGSNYWTGFNTFEQNPQCEGYENIHAGNIENYTSGSLRIWKGTQTQFEEEQINAEQYDFIFIVAE